MIWDAFEERVVAAPGNDSVIYGDLRMTYRGLADLAAAVSATLPEVAARPGRVLVRQKNPCDTLVSVLACWHRGLVPVVLREGMTELQIEEMAGWLRPVAVLTESPPSAAGSHPIGVAPLDPRDEGLVICTSGTTGRPKLVALPAESVVITARAIGRSLDLSSADRMAVNTPLGYMYGLMGGCIAGLLAGAACHLFSPRGPLTQLQAAIRRQGITVVQGPPSLFRLFMGYWNGEPFPGIRMVTTGGEPLGNDLSQQLDSAFPAANKLFLYGMTEAGPRISDLAVAAGGGTDGCVGVPYSHFDWRLDPVPGSEAGRFVLRGPSVFLGYITADGGYEGLDSEGFFHSNDLLSVGSDGRLHFRGRLDRIFRSGGRLVNPDAVERVLASHPSVEDAVCHAEPHPVLGLVPVAEIVVRPHGQFDPASLRSICAAHVEPHAIPRRITQAAAGGLAESGKRRRPAGPSAQG